MPSHRERFRQHGRGLQRGLAAGVQAQVGDVGVQRPAYRSEFQQGLFPIRALQQRAAAVAGEALQLVGYVEVQVHDEAACLQESSVACIQHHAAAGGEHKARVVENRAQALDFAGTETGFARAFEDGRDAGAGLCLDLVVEVGEAQAKAFGQQPPDGALAGAHRSDQGEVGGGVHPHDLNNPPPSLAVPGNRRHTEGNAMSVAKVIELNASSKTGIDDAVKHGLAKCAETVNGIQGAWVNEIKVVCGEDGSVKEWRVNLRISFLVK